MGFMKNKLDTTNLGAKRTSALLRAALFRLLGNTPFEKITLIRLCKEAMIPRSTFYRHFEDKYALLNYSIDIFFEENQDKTNVVFFYDSQTTASFINKMFEKIDINRVQYQKIFQVNKNGILFAYLQEGIIRILEEKIQIAAEAGLKIQVNIKLFTLLMSNFILYCTRVYLEFPEMLDRESFAENVRLFVEKRFFK
jgi:hypothetical protein